MGVLEKCQEGSRFDIGHVDVRTAFGQSAEEHGVKHGTARRQHVLVSRDLLRRTCHTM